MKPVTYVDKQKRKAYRLYHIRIRQNQAANPVYTLALVAVVLATTLGCLILIFMS